jgi:hypothetical protein
MTERLLQFIWQFQYFSKTQLETVDNESLTILHPGQYNTHQGPDFFDAKIRIAGTLWAGTVELHIKTSDWDKHKHNTDCKYENVILHVVWEDDGGNNTLPLLELKSRIPKLLLQRYEELMMSATFIPCSKSIHSVSALTWTSWKDRLLAERLLRKAETVKQYLSENKGHWEETFWWLLARNFGMHVNSEAFEAVARSIPLSMLARHKNQIHQLEALLLGQAGLLDEQFTEDYPRMLQKEYRFSSRKQQILKVHTPVLFLRMRPGNFPSIRLAQLAMLIHTSAHLFSRIKEMATLKEVKECFNITANDYWHYHYRLDKPSGFKKKNLGTAMIDNIIINTICPVLFAYGCYHKEEQYKDKALQWLRGTVAETSSITRGFRQMGVAMEDAADTQALLELKQAYCDQRKCLDCSIGNVILKQA